MIRPYHLLLHGYGVFSLNIAYSCILRPSYKAMNFHICIATYCFKDGLVQYKRFLEEYVRFLSVY
jgi:hypothetical protein